MMDTKALLAIADELDEWGGIEEAVAQLRALAAQADAQPVAGQVAEPVATVRRNEAGQVFMHWHKPMIGCIDYELYATTPSAPDLQPLRELADEWELLDAGHYFADALTAALSQIERKSP